MAVNRAVKLTAGEGDALQIYELVEIPKPKASPGHVVVRMVLRPVNPTDTVILRPWKSLDLSQIVLGSEGVGVVDEVGEGVTKVKVGHRVIPVLWNRYVSQGYGLWRDYVEVSEIDLVPVPEEMSDEIAAQFIVNPWTAWGLVKQLEVPKGEYLLQTAAGSVLGRLVISLAKYYGIKSINVVRREELVQPLKDLGADYVINSSTQDWQGLCMKTSKTLKKPFIISLNFEAMRAIILVAHVYSEASKLNWLSDVEAKVKEITGGKGAYGGLDPVAGESTGIVMSSVRAGGKVLVFGGMSGSRVTIDREDLKRGVSLGAFVVNDFSHDLPKRAETVSEILELLSKKIMQPNIGKTYPLEEFKEAIRETLKDARGGKVLLSSY